MTLNKIKNLKLYMMFAGLFFIASAGTLYYYSTLLSRSGLYAVAGTQENYSWAIAKFAMKLSEFDVYIERQKKVTPQAIEDIKLQNQILQSRFYVLSNLSESTAQLYNEPGYTETIKNIGLRLANIDRLIEKKSGEIELGSITKILEQIHPNAIIMANLTDHAEVKHRNNAYEDFIKKRRIIFFGLFVIMFSIAALTATLIINTLQLRRTIKQQSKAIHAEQQAILAASESVRTKNAFLGAIGHELRTSLQTIMSAIDVLVHSKAAQEHHDTFQRLDIAAQQIETHMRDLTDYARLDSGKLELRTLPFDAGELIESIANDLRKSAKNTAVTFNVENKAHHHLIHSDPVRLRQIVTNLLSNAFKYTEEGAITLDCYFRKDKTDTSLMIEVKDTGVGIPEDKQAIIFMPFTQIDTSHTRKYDGAGMGLAIVRALVDLFNGNIALVSEVDKGTQFTVSLPVNILAANKKAENPQVQKPINMSNRFILVIDDNLLAREAFSALLRQLDCEHEVCDAAERGLQKLMRRPYDALLLDIQMPGRDGISIAKELRKVRGPNRHIPIIAVSAYAPEQLSPEQRALFDDYLMKPVRLDVLSAALANAFVSFEG